MTRVFDILLSFIAIVVLLPFMIPIMIGLKLTGEHDIFYGQERYGKNGETFKVWKFATMLRNSPNMAGGTYTEKNDPRILPMGRFLRKTKINELPQLINILVGDMSIIGYRPLMFKLYHGEAAKKIYANTPGLSGIGSVVFRNEEDIMQRFETKEEKDEFYLNTIMPYKTELEVWYSEHKSFGLYWKLIFLTIDSVLGGDKWKKQLKGLPEVPDALRDVL